MSLDDATKCEDQTDESPPAVDEAWDDYRLNVEKEMGEYVERKFRAGSTKAKVIFDKNNLL